MANIKIIESKREAIFAHVTSLYDFSKKVNFTETRSQEDFMSQTANLDRLYAQFNSINDDYNGVSSELDEKYEPNYKVWLAFEDIYSRVQYVRTKVLESRRAKEKPSDAAASSNKKPVISIKLPPIELPKFDGKPENWPLFYNSFKLNIHENTTLNDTQRVQYLIGQLSGPALVVFAGTIPNEQNYSSIWDSLVKKYQDTRALGTYYLNSIFENKCATSTANNLNNFVERFASSKAALEQLGITDLNDFIFMHIALKGVDAKIAQSFEMSVRDKEIPLCSDLIEYLRQQVKIIERTNTGTNVRNIPHANSRAQHGFTSVIRQRNTTVTPSHTYAITASNDNNDMSCSMCHKTDHSRIYVCPKFKSLSVKSRFEFIKTNKYCTNCLSTKHTHSQCNSQSLCRSCNQKHHTLIHFDTQRNVSSHAPPAARAPTLRSISETHAPSQIASAVSGSVDPNAIESVTATAVTMHARSANTIQKTNTTILLSTAQVYAYSKGNNEPTLIRCLIDSASQNNLISLQCCKKLNLQILPLYNSVIKYVGSVSTPTLGYVSLTIKSRISDEKYNINLIVVERLTEQLPTEYIEGCMLDHLINIPMADETWNIPGEIDALLGAQLFPYLLLGGRICSSSSAPAPPALETTLGYIIMGKIPMPTPDVAWSFGPLISNEALNEHLHKFWELEELQPQCFASADDIKCEDLYASSIKRDDNGKYTVALPFKHSPNMIGNSYVIARRRLLALERKLKANPDLPHHAIVRPDKSTTKCRIVLDASAKTETGFSLNDLLYTGPNLQADLFTLLLNFRLFAVALSADIQQMYLRISLSEEHRIYQKILFRFNDSEPLRIFQFNSVAFGVRSSPFLAMRTIKQLSNDESERFPLASKIASRELYMDDLTSSVMTDEEGIIMSKELLNLFKSGGFDLLKWSSNSANLLSSLPETHRAAVEFSDGDNLKILGIKWLPMSDHFSFTTSKPDEGCTKRIILSTIARLFDVLGLVAPVILYAKLIMQELWLAKVGWDETPPQYIVDSFNQFKAELPLLSNLKISRHLGVVEGCKVNIVAYGDASLKAYGCAIYLHITDAAGNISFKLVCSKSKVAPVKTVSLARLELCAALLLSQLVRIVYNSFNERYKINNIYAFSDSTITLSWIHSSPHRWQIFVANRVAKIHENLSAKHFYHINGIENPSDCLSRGLLPSQLEQHSLWWLGPPWARFPVSEWPVEPFSASAYDDMPEAKRSVTLTSITTEEHPLIYTIALKFSNWTKLLRVVVYILRFLRKLPRAATINALDMQTAENVVIYNIQRVYFKNEIKLIQTSSYLPQIYVN